VQLAVVQALNVQNLVLVISFSGEHSEINLAAEEAQRNTP
jgi:DNA-binding MurR/RpiR family transcriptional regulator